jgi:hypothetical protein
MGNVSDVATQLSVTLEPENLIGRSPRCAVRLSSTLASSVHASLRWTSKGWTLKDLGSTNGSYLNGRRLEPGRTQLLSAGDVIAFGALDLSWVLQDDHPPVPTVIADDGMQVSGLDLIAIPSPDEPVVTLYLMADGSWHAEGPDQSSESISDGAELNVAGKRWRCFFPTLIAETDVTQQHDVSTVHLNFGVSRDEEHVELTATTSDTTINLGVRANNYLLLTLARQRAEDRQAGLEESEQGWVHQDTLAQALRTDPEAINVDVFRIRKRFGQHYRNAARIIERRPRTGQLRLGVGTFEIRAL